MSLLGSSSGMTGDIWSTGAFSFESPLKDLLDSENYTLEQLLAEDELLQELRGIHPKLIEYFSTEEAVTKLVQYAILPPDAPVPTQQQQEEEIQQQHQEEENHTDEPKKPGEWLQQNAEEPTTPNNGKTKTPQQDPEMLHIRFPYMACEIICCEVTGIINTLVDGQVKTAMVNEIHVSHENVEVVDPRPNRILDLLFSLLYQTEPGKLDDYRAGYFEKILSVLFRKRPDDMTTYLNQGGGRGAETLMKAMFQHLYSQSIMQIAQRLLLPKRPVPQKQELEGGNQQQQQDDNNNTAKEDDDDDDLLTDPLDSGGIHDDDDVMAIRCDWSESKLALDLLLDSLIGPDTPPENEIEVEQRLDLSQNTSEVLITIIQNSLLSSKTILSLTSSDTIDRLVTAATTVADDDFSPHESLLTSAMNVLESLILQLGGYGAVGTMSLIPEDNRSSPEENEKDGSTSASESEGPLIANLTGLLEHLPRLLEKLAKLLRHPSTKQWTSPMQFDNSKEQQLLGSSRLRIIRVLEALVLLGDPEVDAKLVQSDIMAVALDLFWEFQWCSMLHQSVANLLVHIFEGQNARFEMQEHIVDKCNLLGRLMDSFLEVQENHRLSEVVANMNDVNMDPGTTSSAASDKSTDKLPVSEDDVDAFVEKQESEAALANQVSEAALRNQASEVKAQVRSEEAIKGIVNVEDVSTEAVHFESRDPSTIGVGAPSQSFRMGYMGHVIIICQALVQACSNDQQEQDTDMNEEQQGEEVEFQNEGSKANEPLMLAEMIKNHESKDRWQEFVTTTLASETAIQSTPLGGFSGAGSDPLHAHRPGLIDDGDVGGLDLPPRGMLGGGDIIDMDDNDLEVAATMMAGLSLGRPATGDGPDSDGDDQNSSSENSGSGDSEKSYNSGETNRSGGGYLFDDPLGKSNGLGIELGKLTAYRPGQDDSDHGQAGDGSDDGNSSSDEEEPADRQDSDKEVPVMDLFAGNFDYNEATPADAEPDTPGFDAGFANFDDAFVGQSSGAEEDFGEFTSADDAMASETKEASEESSSKSAEIAEIEEIFGKGDHADLLDQLDEPDEEGSPPEAEYIPPDESVLGTFSPKSSETTSVLETEPTADAGQQEIRQEEMNASQEEAQEAAPTVDEAPQVDAESEVEKIKTLPSEDDLQYAPSDELDADKATSLKEGVATSNELSTSENEPISPESS